MNFPFCLWLLTPAFLLVHHPVWSYPYHLSPDSIGHQQLSSWTQFYAWNRIEVPIPAVAIARDCWWHSSDSVSISTNRDPNKWSISEPPFRGIMQNSPNNSQTLLIRCIVVLFCCAQRPWPSDEWLFGSVRLFMHEESAYLLITCITV